MAGSLRLAGLELDCVDADFCAHCHVKVLLLDGRFQAERLSPLEEGVYLSQNSGDQLTGGEVGTEDEHQGDHRNAAVQFFSWFVELKHQKTPKKSFPVAK